MIGLEVGRSRFARKGREASRDKVLSSTVSYSELIDG